MQIKIQKFVYLQIFLYLCTRKMIQKILKHSKWTILYLVWMCGIIILYASFVLDPEVRQEMILYNSLYTLLVPPLFAFTSGKMRTWGLIVFSIFAIPAMLIETGWFFIDQSTLIRNQFWAIFATNPEEAFGLLSMYQVWQWMIIIGFLAISLTLLALAIKESRDTTHRLRSTIALIGIACLCLIPDIRYNVPCINLYNSYRGYRKELKMAQQFLSNRQDISGLVVNEFKEEKATIVVIIGESLTRNHCSLYGYCRPTTPKLDCRNDIVVYQNVVAPDFMTQTVLQKVLTFADEEHPEARWNSPTLPELLNAAGWHTYWYDPYEGRNNTSKTIPTSFSSIAKLCTSYYLCSDDEQYDGAYLQHLNTIVQDSTADRKAVFLHLIGNHFPYKWRYPKPFAYFTNDDICSSFAGQLSDKQKEIINAYDDAVRYNDWFVDSVLNILCNQPGSCAMLYFSDHGEEVFDNELYSGRSFNHITNGLYEIPCLFWQNDVNARCHPLSKYPDKPYCTGNMIHTLLDLFAVSYSQKDTCRSLFRQESYGSTNE